jgi:capsid protein
MPFNVASGNSSGYNYASGRLDHQSYDRSIEIDRSDIAQDVLDRLKDEWLKEYAQRKSLSKDQIAELTSHEWHFAGRGHVDPTKEANADNVRLANWTTTEALYWARQGKDGKRERKQRIRELIDGEMEWNKARADAGLPAMPYPPSMRPNAPQTEADMIEVDDEEGEEKTGSESGGLDKWL